MSTLCAEQHRGVGLSRTDPPVELALHVVGDAVTSGAPVVVLVTDALLPLDERTRRADHAAELAGRGCAVLEWSWRDTTAGSVLLDVDSVLRAAAKTAVAVVADVEVLSEHAALALVETAWHAGGLTLLRWGAHSAPVTGADVAGPSGPAVASTLRAALAHVDVLVADGEPTGVLSEVVCERVTRCGADDVLTLMGPLEALDTDLTLTVVVTTFDRPVELEDCLEALTRQTLAADRFDVVVVDDGSVVDVTPVVELFSGRLRTQVLTMPVNSGIGAARAAGVRAATGDIVFLLDDDDVPTPRALDVHLRFHDSRRGEEVAVLGHTVVQPSERPDVLSRHVTRVGGQYFSYGLLRDGQVLEWDWCWGGRSSIKRSLLERISFRSTVMEDADFAWRADQDLRARGSQLEVVYSRHAVQLASSPLRLAQMRRRQMKMGLAAGAFKRSIGEDLSPHLRGALGACAARAALPRRVVDELDAWVSQPLVAVRSASRSGAAENRLARLDSLLMTDLSAHHALGLLVAERAAGLRAAGTSPVIGVDAACTGAVGVVAATRPGDGVRLVVGLHPEQTTPDAFVDAVVEALHSEGRHLDDIGEVELRVDAADVSALSDVHFFLPSDDSSTPGASGQLPLFGLHPLEWVAWFTSQGTVTGALR